MKYNFRKISAIAMSVMTLGLTAGIAPLVTADNYPGPFVDGGQADFAVVHGSNAAATDQAEATSVANSLLALASGSVGLGSDAFEIQRTGNKFHLGDNANGIRDTLRKEQLPTLLADGDFLDDDNTEFKFTQKIELSTNLALKHFRDSDLDNVPTIGISLTSSGTEVLNYSLEFQTKPDFTAAKLETTTLELFGKEYFISKVESNKLTLLDSATTTVLNTGESTTLNVDGTSYDVSIVAIDSTGVIFSVNGQNTNRLGTGDTYKTAGGAHIGVKDFQQAQFQGDTAFADFSLGSGKLELTEGSEVELNDDTVEGLTVVSGSMNESSKFKGVKLQWKTSDREWVTPDHEMTLPGFEAFKLSMTEFVTPSSEEVMIQDSGNHIALTVPLAGGSVTLPILYHTESAATIKGIGESDDKLLVTSRTNLVQFDAGENHEWFVASWEGSTNAYSEVFRVSSVNSDNETSIRALGSGTSYTVADGSTIVAGDIELKVDVHERVSSSDFIINITNQVTGNMSRIYTADGLRIYLPVDTGVANTTAKGDISLHGNGNETTGHNASSWYFYMDEQNKDQTLGAGTSFNLTLTPRSADDDTIHVSAVGGPTMHRVKSTDNYVGYVESELATRIDWDKSGDEHTAKVTYHGEEAYGKVYVSSTDSTDDNALELGDVLVTDSEVSSVQNRNLVVIGGSCVNSVAAQLVGGAYCGSAWTDATGVGSGEFVIESFENPNNANKVALLVAGYERDDTVNAATYLRQQGSGTNVDAGQKYTGSTSTSVEAVVN